MLRDQRLFLRQFFENYHHTGAVAPSGRWLADALCRYLHQEAPPRRVLEVGPGTGAVTARLIRCLRPGDQLDLVELNERFVAHLRQRLVDDPCFSLAASQVSVFHQPVETLQTQGQYDVVISGLPLNNFAVCDVEQILQSLLGMLKPGGVLSFFEYIAVRSAKSLVANASERERLRGISRCLGRVLGEGEIRRDWVWPNVPPAWVHHVQAR